MATITAQGTQAGSVSQTTETLTLAGGVASGTLLVLGLFGNAAATDWTSVTDSASNTWVGGTFVGGNSQANKFYWSVLTTALQAADTIVATSAGARVTGMILYSVTSPGGSSATVMDAEAGQTSSVNSTTFDSGATATTVQASEVVFGLGNTGGATTLTKGASFTAATTLNTTLSNRWAIMEYKEVASTGAYNADGSFNVSTAWTAIVTTFKLGGVDVTMKAGSPGMYGDLLVGEWY